MKWSKLKYTILGILLLIFCSCEEIVQDGTVSAVQETYSIENNYKYKVKVKKFMSSAPINGGDFYWFWTNDTLMVGDTIYIGKIN